MPEESLESVRKKFEALKRVHDSTNEAVGIHVAEINSLQALVEKLMTENMQYKNHRVSQEQIIQLQIQKLNQEKIEQANEIQRLRGELKKLKNGPID